MHCDVNHRFIPIDKGCFPLFVKIAPLLKKYQYQLNKCYFGYFI